MLVTNKEVFMKQFQNYLSATDNDCSEFVKHANRLINVLLYTKASALCLVGLFQPVPGFSDRDVGLDVLRSRLCRYYLCAA